jgi:hypothetical protein
VSGNILICELQLKEFCAETSSTSALISGQGLLVSLVGLHVLPDWITDNHYQDFLMHDLPKLLEDVPLAVRALMWYIHDGAPEHFSHAV